MPGLRSQDLAGYAQSPLFVSLCGLAQEYLVAKLDEEAELRSRLWHQILLYLHFVT